MNNNWSMDEAIGLLYIAEESAEEGDFDNADGAADEAMELIIGFMDRVRAAAEEEEGL